MSEGFGSGRWRGRSSHINACLYHTVLEGKVNLLRQRDSPWVREGKGSPTQPSAGTKQKAYTAYSVFVSKAATTQYSSTDTHNDKVFF